ncbi:PaaI family thioesterase ASCRUDRAFT_6593 [Ascoidea rubescens DSM 1968]|uniref:Thioesterase domain-containing protein n=1 Tax=Ascoidea rubescens DSM 1968 TaxID=1344418 RepID=A0A1D2VN00_9ASCO|nr:hypothetical protein ASCRUDRAFT_6593 [Ascoidea rubescens DSM 1968]ODV62983.1 hypothetical protein ASCRUDRAFT_6593 [Ascoidea rubescens DSM 1968]
MTKPVLHSQEVDAYHLHLLNHPYVQHLQASKDFHQISHVFDTNVNRTNGLLTSHTLAGSDLISNPIIFSKLLTRDDGGCAGNADGANDEDIHNEIIAFFHLGNQLNGQFNIVHGGLLATLLDENLYRCCVPLFKNSKKFGVTANLNINYKNPTFSDSFIMLHAKITRVEKQRKFYCYGKIENLLIDDNSNSNYDTNSILNYYLNENDIDNDINYCLNHAKNPNHNLLVEANILVIEPKWAPDFQSDQY